MIVEELELTLGKKPALKGCPRGHKVQEQPELDKMAFSVPFSTMGNELWEIDIWELGFVWLLTFWGFSIGNDGYLVGNGG